MIISLLGLLIVVVIAVYIIQKTIKDPNLNQVLCFIVGILALIYVARLFGVL